ncbi:MAG: ATP-binding cassette domain-containing protein, partial [Micrococcales bacterium]|nr:ATP-binding cassette domain-containing protein [Micrococcales bacterium]
IGATPQAGGGLMIRFNHATFTYPKANAPTLRDVTAVIGPGELGLVMGLTGSGKTTLLRLVNGLVPHFSGGLLSGSVQVDQLDTRQVRPRDLAGVVGYVSQDPTAGFVTDLVQDELAYSMEQQATPRAVMRTRVEEVIDLLGLEPFRQRPLATLSAGQAQRVAMAAALTLHPKVLILDEPTAVLTPQETDQLMDVMRQLANQGTSIVFITHKLREVQAVADSITVIRHGKVVGVASPQSSQTELASMMVGRPVSLTVDKAPAKPGPVALKVSDLSLVEPDGRVVLDEISLEVQHGEVLAIAGVQGNGQTELAKCLMGLIKPTGGTITLEGMALDHLSVRRHLDLGIGYVPEDRATDGMVGSFTIAENLVLDQYHRPPFSQAGWLRPTVIGQNANHKVKQFDIRTTSVDLPITALSGGNQQKVVLARELSRELKLLVAAQPTRGLDVGSIEFVHNQVVSQRDKGTPVVIIATELDEVEALADRIAVMYRGALVGVVPAGTPRSVLGLMMAGVPAEQAFAQTNATALGRAEGGLVT